MRGTRLLRAVSVILAVVLALYGLDRLSGQRASYGAHAPSPPLPVPEDSLGQHPGQAAPEISIQVDTRDGHLTVRVVDIWGPGRVPLVVRSYTNTAPSGDPATGWHFNQHLDVLPAGSGIYKIAEPDGNRGDYRWVGGGEFSGPAVHLKPLGTVSTMEMPYVCVGPPFDRDCTWNGQYNVFLPKGLTRRFVGNPKPEEQGIIPGLITEERDADGNVTTFTWTGFPDGIRAYIGTVRDPVGRETTYQYERGSFAERICREIGDRCAWGDFFHYRVRSVTDPYGRVATYVYDSGRLVTVTNGAGFITRYAYDGAGRLTSVTNARGHTTTIEWTEFPDSFARVTRVTAPDTTATTYAYTLLPSGRVGTTVLTNARSHQTTYQYYDGWDQNYFGNLQRVTDPLGNITQYAYDARHNVIQVTDPRSIVTRLTYNDRNRVLQTVQADGTLNLTTTLTWDANDNLLSVTTPRGIRTEYTYNASHNLTLVRKAAGTADESVTQYTYTPWGGVASVTDPRGFTTNYTYTTRRQVETITPPAGGTIRFAYDLADNLITRTDGNGRLWTTASDAARLVTAVTDPLSNQVRHEYDPNGNRTRTIDAKLRATTFTYDTRDRLTLIADPLGGQTAYAHDPVGNLTRITDARGHATDFAYDAAGRLVTVTDALGQATQYDYDRAGNRTSLRDRKGQLFTSTYDEASRLRQVSAPGQTLLYTFDPNGNRLTLTDPTGTTGYAYNSLDWQTRITYPDGRTVQAGYDRAGNRTSLTNPGGVTYTYGYDGASRLTQVAEGLRAWTFTYDSAGNRTGLTAPNSTSTTYTYLANHWLASITHQGLGSLGGTVFQSVSYTYDQNGNRLTQIDPSGTTTFTYDSLNRLTQAAHPETYGTWGWTYDAVGNRLSQTGPGGVTTYTYDRNNRLTQAGGAVYSYDPNGNLTGVSTGQTFTYDPFDRLVQASTSSIIGSVTYTYNGDGLKVRRVAPDGATTQYYYDGIRPIWETDGTGAMTAQLDRDLFGNLLSRTEPGGARFYVHPDGLGSTTALTDDTGAVAATMLYDAWGNVRANDGEVQGKYRFTGAERDETTGLYHMGARFYDPAVGRWLTEDPIREAFDPSSLNFYAYVENNPMVLVDPDGRDSMEARLILVAAPSLGILGLASLVILAGFATGIGLSVLRNQRLEKHLGKKIEALEDWFTGLRGQMMPGDLELWRWGKNKQKAQDTLQGLRNLAEEILAMIERGGLTRTQRRTLELLLHAVEQMIAIIEQALRKADAR